MSHSITLTPQERNTLLGHLRRARQPELRLRAHIILLLADGHSWSTLVTVLYCSSRTIARWQQRFAQGRAPAPLGRTAEVATDTAPAWAATVVGWVTQQTPRAFGFFRSRWCCVLLALLLWQQHRIAVSREPLRRWLHGAGLVWRRPRPVLRRHDPQREEILQQLRRLLLALPADATVVFEDEVDVNLNPDIGCMWMRRGEQAEVVTPGDNAKCYLAGSRHWRTGKLLTTKGDTRDGKLFVAHLHELRRRWRRYKKIHVTCDNAHFHDQCWEVWEVVHRHGERVVLHFLPKYAPECNPIERIWWHLHEAIPRNHQCKTLQELVDLVLGWLADRKVFPVEDQVYRLAEAG